MAASSQAGLQVRRKFVASPTQDGGKRRGVSWQHALNQEGGGEEPIMIRRIVTTTTRQARLRRDDRMPSPRVPHRDRYSAAFAAGWRPSA